MYIEPVQPPRKQKVNDGNVVPFYKCPGDTFSKWENYLTITNPYNGSIYFNTLQYIVKDHHAIISGGAVLQCVRKQFMYTQDFDVYVHAKDATKLYYMLLEKGFSRGFKGTNTKGHIAPVYDQSFLRRNHILYRFGAYMDITLPQLDIIVVHNDYMLQDVVTNFDLMCCEIWYAYNETDETYHTYTETKTNYENIKNSQTFLRDVYCEALLVRSNAFTLKRLQKYISRDFVITYGTPNIETVWDHAIDHTNRSLSSFVMSKNKRLRKTTEGSLPDINRTYFYEEWLVSKILDVCFQGRHNRLMPIALNYYNSDSPTLENPMAKLERLVKEMDMEDFLETVKDYIPDYESFQEEFTDIHNNGYVEICKKFINMKVNEQEKSETPPTYKPEQPKFTMVHDIIMYTDVPESEWFKDKDNYAMILPGEEQIVIGLSKEYLVFLYNDSDNNWFYECADNDITDTEDKQPVPKGDPYCAITVDKEGMKGLVPVSQLSYVLQQEERKYVINHKGSFSYTISFNNTTRNADYVSTNHCQRGSTYLVYEFNKLSDTNEPDQQLLARWPEKNQTLTTNYGGNIKPKP